MLQAEDKLYAEKPKNSTSAACLSFAEGSFAASFLYVGMLFLNNSTQSSRLGRSLQSHQQCMASQSVDQAMKANLAVECEMN